MPILRCPHVTCQHNTSGNVQEPGLCNYDGVLEMASLEDKANEQQYLDCRQYTWARRKRLHDPNCVAVRGTVYYPVDVEG